MFGTYDSDFVNSDTGISVRIERSVPVPRYTRSGAGGEAEKILPPGGGSVTINPVEPVNLPLAITQYLEISFPAIVVLPGGCRQVFLTFPIEIGVFYRNGGMVHVLDIFSVTRSKYSLYGSPGAGQITRWHRSGVFMEPPTVPRLECGVLSLSIRNNSEDTVEVSRTVIDSGSMHIFWGEQVEMAGTMEIFSPLIARTAIGTTPCGNAREPSIELYAARKIPQVHGRGHLMEFGVS